MLGGQSSFIQITANHANDELVSVGVLSAPCANHAALAHNAYPIANTQHLSELMSNDHNAVPLCREFAQRERVVVKCLADDDAVEAFKLGETENIVRLGDAFDHALTDPAIAAAWCPPDVGPASQEETDLRFVREAVFDRISKLDLASLNEAIAETAAAIKANARDSVISFGPAPPRRSAE